MAGYRDLRHPAITRTSCGDVLVAFEATEQLSPNQDAINVVAVVRSPDHGKTWSVPQVVRTIENETEYGLATPSFVLDNVTGRLFLMTIFGFLPEGGQDLGDTLRIQLSYSDDCGRSWKHRDITTQIEGPHRWRSRAVVPGHGIQLANGPWTGRLMQPVVIEDETGIRRFVAVCSDDQGVSWWAGNPVGEGARDCTVAEISDGRVVMKAISDSDGECMGIYTEDGGRNWRGAEACFNKTPRGATAVVEAAFPWSPIGTPQAKAMLHPQAFYQEDGTVPFSVVMASDDELHSFCGMAQIDSKQMDNPDVASYPEYRLAVVAYGTDRGIEVALVPYDIMGLRDLAYGWNLSGAEQDRILADLGLLSA